MAVLLDRPPHNVFLAAWGRHATGWWACITFRARVVGDDEPELAVAAWVPAHSVRKGARVTDQQMPKLLLPEHNSDWPMPPRWPSWYAGVWPDGPLPLPPGVALVAGPGWRNKPARGPS